MKPDALRTVTGAMRFHERKQQAVAHNLANASTRGFKAEQVFARMVPGSAPVADGRTDLRAGSVNPTGNALDIALEGTGFLVVETPDGTRLSRGGSFSLNEYGALVDETGARLLGSSGEIVLPEGGEVEIGADGAISVDGEQVDALRMESADPTVLRRQDGGYFLPEPGDRNSEPPADLKVRQGHLEESNVDPVGTMVEMIDGLRVYASLQRSAQSIDGVRRTVANDLARID